MADFVLDGEAYHVLQAVYSYMEQHHISRPADGMYPLFNAETEEHYFVVIASWFAAYVSRQTYTVEQIELSEQEKHEVQRYES